MSWHFALFRLDHATAMLFSRLGFTHVLCRVSRRKLPKLMTYPLASVFATSFTYVLESEGQRTLAFHPAEVTIGSATLHGKALTHS